MSRTLPPRARARAYTLIEVILTLALIAAAMLGVFRLMRYAQVSAHTATDQKSLGVLADAVRGIYQSAPNFSGASDDIVVKEARLLDVNRDASGQPVSAWGGHIAVEPFTIKQPDDAFALSISGVDRAECLHEIPAVDLTTTQIIAGGSNIQAAPEKTVAADAVAVACASPIYAQSAGTLTLVYADPRAVSPGGFGGPACATSCAPGTQSQTLPCPAGEIGQVTETRSSTCGSGTCPTPAWGAWTMTSSSCAPAPTITTTPPPVPPTAPCFPSKITRSRMCPAGQVGSIVEQQSTTCPGGVAQTSGWTQVSDSCTTPPPVVSCVPGVVHGVDACPAGAGGQITWTEDTTCGPGGTQIVGAKVITSDTCQVSCEVTGTCCRPSTQPSSQTTSTCPAGTWGQITVTSTTNTTCPSATATPVPTTAQSTSGSCQACPSPTTSTATQWVAQSAACPAGQVGAHTWQQEQQRTTTTSYACNPATLALPAPTVTTTSWADVTGATRADTDTCASSLPVPSATSIAGASWAFGTVDVAPISGATYYRIGASCGPGTGPVAGTVYSVNASTLKAITTANPFDSFVPAGRANANATYGALPETSCLGAPGLEVEWPVQVWAQACNSAGCSAWSAPVVAYCSWSKC